MSVDTFLREAVAQGRLRDADYHLARTLNDMAGSQNPELLLAAALLSQHTGQGHVCLELERIAGTAPFPDVSDFSAPSIEEWRNALKRLDVVGRPGEDTPLILNESERLYLGRYWHFEATITNCLRTLAEQPVKVATPALLRERLDHYFPATGEEGPDLQKVAAATALLSRLTVISGGPGTGKTTTVARLLALLIEASSPDKAPRIVLAAPTGKAAARLSESLEQARATLDCDPSVRKALSIEAATIHRLLGWIPGQTGFRHNADNPLHLDVLVVDEASMVDVPLMARLLQALPEHARLVLLGDKDQLASVEAGSVLGDICNRGERVIRDPEFTNRLSELGVEVPKPEAGSSGPLANSLVVLTKSYRFGGESGIGNLARAVNRGDAEAALKICEDEDYSDAVWAEVNVERLPAMIADRAIEAYSAYLETKDATQALEAFGRFRFLCALREGPFGVKEVNQAVEKILRQKGLIPGNDESYYTGRPIMVTRNDYSLRLFNGDIGLVLRDPESDGRLRAFFPTNDGSLRRVLLSRLPPHETVFAMTIHKSQGSEFDACAVILPDTAAPVVTRELVYTGITRARKRVEVWGGQTELRGVLTRRVERTSGLREALWGEDKKPCLGSPADEGA